MPRKKEPQLTNSIREPAHRGPRHDAARPGRPGGRDAADDHRPGGGAYAPSLALALRIAKVFGKKTDDVFRLEE